jgi:stage II sporulation protein D
MRSRLIILCFLIGACSQSPPVGRGRVPGPVLQDAVRVALQVSVEEVRFVVSRGVEWDSVDHHGSTRSGECRIVARDGRMQLLQGAAVTDLGPDPVRFRGAVEWKVGADRFGGDLLVQRAPWEGVTLVNVVSLEEYLRGVVPWEIGRPGPDALEAVKAQAIAARTYTIRHLGRWSELGFDVYADVRDQVYRGYTGTVEITDRAVRETRGQIIVYDSEPVRAYYSSTCGGHTSTLTEVWDREGAPYLRGFRDADSSGESWCRESAQFRWTEAWSAKELGDGLRQHIGAELGQTISAEEFGILIGLEVLQRDSSGRVARLKILSDRAEFVVQGDRIRWVLRPAHSRFGILRSTLFRIEEVRRDDALVQVIIRGGGFGHGVGLCQTGALGRARAGQRAREILGAYYPGTTVQTRPPGEGPA